MNNRHLYKAKRLDNGEWAEGFYYCMSETTYVFEEDYEQNSVPIHHYILFERMTDWGLPNQMMQVEIDQSTLCQRTGLKDKQIWENDIITFEDTREEGYEYKEGFDFQNRAVVVWSNGRFELDKFASNNSAVMEDMNNFYEDFWNDLKGCEVIGNIFDNPELLEVEE